MRTLDPTVALSLDNLYESIRLGCGSSDDLKALICRAIRDVKKCRIL